MGFMGMVPHALRMAEASSALEEQEQPVLLYAFLLPSLLSTDMLSFCSRANRAVAVGVVQQEDVLVCRLKITIYMVFLIV